MSVFDKISEKFEAISDFDDEKPLITLESDNRIVIENYYAIRLFTDAEVEIAFDKFVVNIKGVSLIINEFNPGMIKISGTVTSIDYSRS